MLNLLTRGNDDPGDAYSDNIGATDFYHSHSLISDETYKKLRDNCDFAYDLLVDNSLHSATCLNTSNYALDVVMRKINIYNIYGQSYNPPANPNRPAFVKVIVFNHLQTFLWPPFHQRIGFVHIQ